MASNIENLTPPSREALALGGLLECLVGGEEDRYDTGEVYLAKANRRSEKAAYIIDRLQTSDADSFHFHVVPISVPSLGHLHFKYEARSENLELVEAYTLPEDIWQSFEQSIEDARTGVLADAFGKAIISEEHTHEA
jgi:hypothetical protein